MDKNLIEAGWNLITGETLTDTQKSTIATASGLGTTDSVEFADANLTGSAGLTILGFDDGLGNSESINFKQQSDGNFLIRTAATGTGVVRDVEVDGGLVAGGDLTASGVINSASKTVVETNALTGMVAGSSVYVTDETGGAVMATYDGSDWRRSTDRAIIS